MVDLEALIEAVNQLSPTELNQLHDYVTRRRRVVWWTVKSENLAKIDALMRPVQEEAAQMTEDEINQVIEQATIEVRREQHTHQGRD